jgi:glycosyltransferase involved in cell wall biosynthesis
MKRIRLLHILTTLDRGGAETQVLSLLSRMPRERFDVTVAWLKGRGDLAPEATGVAVTDELVGRFPGASILSAGLRLVHRVRPHILHTHLMKADMVGGALARLGAVPILVSTKHNEDRHLRFPPMALVARGVASQADRVVVISGAVSRFIERTMGLSGERTRRILYGYPVNGRPIRGVRDDVIAELGLHRSAHIVTMVGRLTRQKGIEDLLHAASFLRDAVPDARFLILGQGELRVRLRRTVANLDLRENVRFLGFRRDVPRILAASDLMVLPSHWEGFGLVLLEAMAQGIPVVGTRVGAIPEVVADGETGLLVPPHDAETLATAILRMLTYPAIAREMGRAGRRRLEEHFHIERAVTEHIELYEELLAERLVEQ